MRCISLELMKQSARVNADAPSVSQTSSHAPPGHVGDKRRGVWDRLCGRGLNESRLQQEFDAQFVKDSLGHRINLWLACFTLIICCLPAGLVDSWAAVPLSYAILRLTNTWRTAWRPLSMPLGICVFLFIAWQMSSTTWSLNPAHGWNEVFKNRWLGAWLIIWPVMDQRGKLIAALKIGLLLGIAAQVVQMFARKQGIENIFAPIMGKTIPWLNDPDRLGGWWHPLAAGSMLLVSLGLHLGPALLAQGRTQILGVLGTAASCIGILMTGTRGAILVMPLVIIAAVTIALMRVKPAAKARKIAAWCCGLIITVGLFTFGMAGDRIVRRGQLLVADVRQAVQDRNFTTDNGARVQMALWSIEAMKARPLTGMGAGSYETFTRQVAGTPTGTQTANQPGARFFEHAHNSLLHIGATLGSVGIVLALSIAACGLAAGTAAALRGGWDVGPGLALLGLVLVSMTDPVHFNTQTGIVWYVVLGLCVIWVPRHRAAVEHSA